jgi:flagellar biogenesis protein FliO
MLTGIGVKVGLAIALALGATAAARYLHLARYGWRPGRGVLRVVETAALGQNRALHLVRVGKRTLFLASTPSRIAMLADVTGEQEEVAREGAEEAGGSRRAARVGLDFAGVLRRLLGGEGVAGAGTPALSARGGPSAERPAGDRAERLLVAASMLRSERARGWVG